MKSVKEKIIYTYEINKSKFISILYYLKSVDDVCNYLEEVKKEYKDASHYCYAYILENIKKCSDDKEPSGTAGKPILEVLEKNELTNVLCIVVRYFGGIKLGAGGLLRAYSKAVSDNIEINNQKIGILTNGYIVTVEITYNDINSIEYKYKNIIDKNFNESIIYTLLLEEQELKEIESKYKIIDKEKTLFIK